MASNRCDTGELVRGPVARVNRDTVTRAGPGLHYEPTGAVVADGWIETAAPEPYRVFAGDRVVVEHGPLRIGDTDWFLVHSAEVRGVVSVGAIVPTSSSWVPASDGEAALFEPVDGTSGECVFVTAGGPGRFALNIPSEQCSTGGLCRAGALAWVAAAPPGETCRFLATDEEPGEVVIEADVSEWSSGAVWSPRETRLTVDTDCIWTLRTTET